MKKISKNCVASQDTATCTASQREVRQSPLGANVIMLNTLGGENPSEIALFGGSYNEYLINLKTMKKVKELNRSIDLPLEDQFAENHGWEDSSQRYLLDQEYQDIDFFYSMDPDEFFHLIRKMDNFLRERGISDYFISNFGKANIAFVEIEKQLNEKQL